MNLAEHVGRTVALEGKASDMPWQHLTTYLPGKEMVYFDLDDGLQILVYVAGGLPCAGRARLTGTVLRIAGLGKRPGSNEEHVEYQLDVERWECLEGVRQPPPGEPPELGDP